MRLNRAGHLILSVGAALALGMTLRLANAGSELFAIIWPAAAILFGATCAYTLVMLRRPRRLRGGMYFLLSGIVWLAAAVCTRPIDVDGRPLLLFAAAGASLMGAVLADNNVVGAFRPPGRRRVR